MSAKSGMVEISAEALSRVEKILSGVPGGARKALSSAMNRGLSRIKTVASKEVREVYTVSASAINEHTKIHVFHSTAGNIAGYVRYSGHAIPLYKFKVTPKSPGSGRTVHAIVKKGEGGDLPHHFIGKMESGHTGVFKRKGKERLPIVEKTGLSMAEMVGNDKVVESVEKEVQDTMEKRIEYEISRILHGYGG